MPVISIIQGAAALYVLGVAVAALNRMGARTRHLVRWSFIALGAGATAAAASSVMGGRDVFDCMFAVGVALHLAGNRRRMESP